MHNALQKKCLLTFFLTGISFLQASDNTSFIQKLTAIRAFLSTDKSPEEVAIIDQEYSYERCGGCCMIGASTDDRNTITGCYVIKRLPKTPSVFCIKSIKAPSTETLMTIWDNIFASLDALPEDQKCAILLIALKRDPKLIQLLKPFGFKTDLIRTQALQDANKDEKSTIVMTIDFTKIPLPMALD